MKQTQKNILKNTQILIKIPSTEDNYQGLMKAINFSEQKLKECSGYIKKYEFNKKPSLVFSFRPNQKSFDILLLGHLDVVPAKSENFKPNIKNNRIYGRGSSDMKGGAAVILELIKHFSRLEKKPSLGLVLTTDEELGGGNGAKKLVALGYQAKTILVPDGGNSLSKIANQTKGIIQTKLTLTRQGGPPSLSHKIKNPIEELMSLYFQFKNILLSKNQSGDLTINLGKIQGGEALNKIPQKCELNFEVRFYFPCHLAEIKKIISQIFKNKKIKKRFLIEAKPIFIPEDNAFIQQYKKIAQNILKKKIIFARQKGSHDGRYFAYQGAAILATRPDSKGMHSDTEYVKIDGLYNLFLIYKAFIYDFFKYQN